MRQIQQEIMGRKLSQVIKQKAEQDLKEKALNSTANEEE